MRLKTPRKSESRRIEAKRQRSQHQGTVWRRLTERVSLRVLAIGVGFCAATLLVEFWGSESMQWRRGQQVDRDITARVDFEFEDSVKKQELSQAARDAAPDVYERNEAAVNAIRGELTRLRQQAVASAGDAAKLQQEAASLGCRLDEAAARALLGYAADEQRGAYEALIAGLISLVKDKYIVEKPADPNRRVAPETARMGRDPARVASISELQYIDNPKGVEEAVHQAVADTRECPEILRAPLADLIAATLLRPPGGGRAMPLWTYSQGATDEEMNRAEAGLKREDYTVSRSKNTVLVKAGTELDTAELDLLGHEHAAYLLAEQTDPALRTKKLLGELGMAVVVVLVAFGLGVYTLFYQPRVFDKPARALALAGLMLLAIVMARLIEHIEYPSNAPVEFSLFFVLVASALVAIAYDQRFAFGVSGTLAVLVTLTARGDFGLFLTLMAGVGVTVFGLGDIRTRGKLVGVGALAAVAAGLTALAAGLMAAEEGPRFAVLHAVVAAGMALFAGFFVQGILHYFERLFGVATSMTLLEWSDASQPLLRRLAAEAPGTYSHSVVLSQMAEDACEAIGARGLLARVGALYHDIGKMQKPAYFVENQEARMNRHDGLSPTMSLLIIVGHVKDGVEMARAYNVPRILHQFIVEHHGTTVVKYFHHMASEAAAKNSKTKGRHDREVPDTEFRYPGPKPQSRESAILMLCDSCEGAVRAQQEPTLGRIESTVHQVTMSRLNDGQFDDCDITLRELRQVEQSLVKSLAAVHHGRIKYPKEAGAREEAAAEKGKAGEADTAPTGDDAALPTPEVAHQA